MVSTFEQCTLRILTDSCSMDLFDTTAYFARKVPILAATRPLLELAVCALSAKYLARNALSQTPSLCLTGSNATPSSSQIDWKYKSVEYYDKAIGLLMKAARLENEGQQPLRRGYHDEILAAIAILSTYELMDAPSPEWKAHLSALPLLDISQFDVLNPRLHADMSRTITNRSIFWNFARQDYLSACKSPWLLSFLRQSF